MGEIKRTPLTRTGIKRKKKSVVKRVVKKKRKRVLKKDRPHLACDTLFSKIVRSRGFCENCGATDNLQCAHGISRRYRNIRWAEDNAFCLCASCHVFYTHRPLEWEDWMRAHDVDYDGLKRRALSIDKVDVAAVLAHLRERWAELEAAA